MLLFRISVQQTVMRGNEVNNDSRPKEGIVSSWFLDGSMNHADHIAYITPQICGKAIETITFLFVSFYKCNKFFDNLITLIKRKKKKEEEIVSNSNMFDVNK